MSHGVAAGRPWTVRSSRYASSKRVGSTGAVTPTTVDRGGPAGHETTYVRLTRGSAGAISPARAPESCTAPLAAASASSIRPVASSSHVRGSVSTTFGGVPRVCLGPEMHWTATNGGTRTSTLAPGASVRVCARSAAPPQRVRRVAVRGWFRRAASRRARGRRRASSLDLRCGGRPYPSVSKCLSTATGRRTRRRERCSWWCSQHRRA